MENVIKYPDGLVNPNDKRRLCVASWLRLLAETKICPQEFELSEELLRCWEIELGEIPLEHLEKAFLRVSKESRLFPKPFEIRALCPDPNEGKREQAYAALRERYERAYVEGRVPKSLPSTLDERPMKPHRKLPEYPTPSMWLLWI